jgi:MFS family permease
MVGCGHSVGEAALGIQWHVLAMFGPSFFTGRLMDRFGKRRITALGLILIAASGALALMGLALTHFWGALVLLGLGWNFGFIGATALLTEAYRPSERAKVQALNDFLVFGTVAVASFGSGQLLHSVGWDGINLGMLPLVVVVLALLAWQGLRQRQQMTARG